MRRCVAAFTLCCGLQLGATAALAQISAGQIDDFQDGEMQGWQESFTSPNPPQVISSGGPNGAGDAFLQNTSNGITGPGGRMIMFNKDARWRGDYLQAGITTFAVDLNNLGNQPLNMRFDLVRSNPSVPTNHVFTEGFPILPGSGWQHAKFSLAMDDLFSSGNMSQILGEVTELRLVHEPQTPPMHPGQPVNAVLGIDNIQALGPPVMEDLRGDYNDNGRVEQGDLDLVLLNWGGDFDTLPDDWVKQRPSMGIVDQAELDGVLLNWGSVAEMAATSLVSAATRVPEPATAVLGIVAILGVAVVRRAARWRTSALSGLTLHGFRRIVRLRAPLRGRE